MTPDRKRFLGKSFTLWALALLSVVLVMPYASALAPGALDAAAAKLGVPAGAVIAISILQSAIVLAVIVPAGLWAAGRVGLGVPLLDALLQRRPLPGRVAGEARTALLIGGAAALAIVALDATLFRGVALAFESGGIAAPAAWKGLLASVYGAVAEEIQLRLFLLSFMALGVRQLLRLAGAGGAQALPATAFWVANVTAAVLFGLLHLPMTAELISLTPIVVLRAIVLNAIVGLAAGYLYYRRGLEMAMLCHFAADIVLHVVLPLLG